VNVEKYFQPFKTQIGEKIKKLRQKSRFVRKGTFRTSLGAIGLEAGILFDYERILFSTSFQVQSDGYADMLL